MQKRRKVISGDPLTISNPQLPLPVDLIIEIFSRLPLKCIARCRCVSKLWASILRRPDFTELFLAKSSSRPKILFAFRIRKDSEYVFFSADQPQNVDENSSPVVAKYLTKISFDGFCVISGVFNGLVCLVDERSSKGKKETVPVPMIFNPSTGQVLNLPKLKSKWVTMKKSFGYDPVDKRLKVLSMTRACFGKANPNGVEPEEYRVLTLGTGKLSWRKIEGCGLKNYPRMEICINGVLYYRYLVSPRNMIVCFDFRSEKFSFVGGEENLQYAVLYGTMINYNDKLGLYWDEEEHTDLNGSNRIMRLRVLEDVEKQEWSEHDILYPALWNDLVGKDRLWFVKVSRENEFVFVWPRSRPYLIYFNRERNTLVKVEIHGIDLSKYDKYHAMSTFLYHVEDVKLM